MKSSQTHWTLRILLIGFVAVDIVYLWYRLISDEMLIILYSSGLWLPWQPVLALAIIKTVILGMVIYRFGMQLGLLVLLIDASAGTLLAFFDILQYVILDCDCSIMSDSAWIKLGIRGSVTAVLSYVWVSKYS